MLVLFLAILAIVGYLLRRITAESHTWHPMLVDLMPLEENPAPEPHECSTCGRKVNLAWQYCPNCGTEVRKPDIPQYGNEKTFMEGE